MIRRPPDQKETYEFSPIFDNGTSLGYENAEKQLVALCDTNHLDAYIGRGSHHCSWTVADDQRAPHIELCAHYLKTHPDARSAMQDVLRFEPTDIETICAECTQFPVGVPFTPERAYFVSRLVLARRARLVALLEGTHGKLD
ncbi:hypothetical protein ROR02_23780 [Pararhodospirillum oryzae]|uniref:Uncharacterized protein n=1 Tax=Pararhodospirillum oryzae TaxID=478448 RepID=A0A512H9W8_9PROT|nr:hypothetical protein ROR02_23780 [Pararhodospirillum oryzae]